MKAGRELGGDDASDKIYFGTKNLDERRFGAFQISINYGWSMSENNDEKTVHPPVSLVNFHCGNECDDACDDDK